MIELVMLLAGAVLLINTRTAQILVAYVVLALTVSVLIAPSASESLLSLALFIITTVLKVVVVPIGIVVFLRANPAAGDLRPSLAMPARLAVVIAFALIARAFSHVTSLNAVPMQDLVAYVILCGLGMLMVHRNLLAHLVGLLALGAGVTLAGALLAPTLPEFIELGATFDALIATFIGLALVRAFVAHNPVLDVESLRRLRG
ncbi:MAG TPA: NADH-quinone oxidoreductase subunit K [Candidatus Dormibacteraeota bacterium]|nr:NADH-quinone oxidoreductase subunit K [Candidatus Dormibacteraeota bacterium]